MSNRSNHPVSDTDHRGDRRADDGHGGFEEDPLVELARIVSEGNAKFRPVAMTEPRFEAPAVSPADDPGYVDPSGWDETFEQPHAVPPVAPAHGEADYSDAYAQRLDPEGVPSPSVDAAGSQGLYADAWQDEAPVDDWAEDPRVAEAPRAPQADWPDGPVNRSDDVGTDYGRDPYVSMGVASHDDPGLYPAEPAFDTPAYSGDRGEGAAYGAEAAYGVEDAYGAEGAYGSEDERARAITADLSASLEDELLGPRAGAQADDSAWAVRDDRRDEAFDDLLMDPPAAGWSEGAAPAQNAPYAPSFDEEYYAAADAEAPPPPEGYDLDAVAQAMREGDPQLGGHGVLPPHSALEQDAVPEEKSRRGLVAAAAVLGLVVAGGAVFAFFDFGGSEVVGPPPVITASEEPLKVYPEGEEPAANGQSKLIYDRVGGVETPREERLVVRDETPVASLPPAPVADGDAGTRVTAGPRRVRTVVVRPDGTIISGNDEPSSTDTAAPASTPSASQPVQAPTAAQPAPVPSAPSQVAAGNPTGGARQVTTTPVTAPGATTSLDGGATAPQSADLTVAGEVPANVPRDKPGDIQTLAASAAPPPEIARQTAAAPRDAAPLDLTASRPGTPQPAAPAPATGGSIPAGAYIVQVSSQRTQDQAQAAFDNLRQRYSGVLGGVTPVIQRADLGDRGTFYRVRIPASSRDDAISLCERLKSAGGDCFVRRN
jgi:hypothetical protein